jgi:hypothetical protein
LSGINGKIEGLNTEEKDSFTFVRIFLKGIFDLKNILLLKADFSPPKKYILGLGPGFGPKPKPKTKINSEFNSIYLGIEFNKR